MNLALKDIRHNFGRFALTAVGIGLLLMLVMGMGTWLAGLAGVIAGPFISTYPGMAAEILVDCFVVTVTG